jgi:NADP-dependent 3-hydroxy acid dehydrogenase YdfG
MRKHDDLAGKAALVTGASSGIGAAIVRALARDGANVALSARREERLQSVADEVAADFGVETAVVPADVTDDEAVESAVESAVGTFGGLDIAVCNAGLARDGILEDLSTEAYRQMMDVNCDGMFFTARAAAPHLREAEGNLVFISSFSGQYPRPKNPVYAATKWWTRGLALSLEAVVGADNVGVTIVNPTEVRTEFGSEDGDSQAAQWEPGEVTEPEEIADAVVFACEQRPPNTVSELDLYRRDKMTHF